MNTIQRILIITLSTYHHKYYAEQERQTVVIENYQNPPLLLSKNNVTFCSSQCVSPSTSPVSPMSSKTPSALPTPTLSSHPSILPTSKKSSEFLSTSFQLPAVAPANFQQHSNSSHKMPNDSSIISITSITSNTSSSELIPQTKSQSQDIIKNKTSNRQKKFIAKTAAVVISLNAIGAGAIGYGIKNNNSILTIAMGILSILTAILCAITSIIISPSIMNSNHFSN